MALLVTIAGHVIAPLAGTLKIEQLSGARHVCSFEWEDIGGAGYAPQFGDEVVVTNDAVLEYEEFVEFSGPVTTIGDEGLVGNALVDLKRSIVASDHRARCDQRLVTAAYPAGTLLGAVLADLCTTYLAIFGITLDPEQADGPEIPALSYSDTYLTEVLNDLQTRTGYIWDVSFAKVFGAYPAVSKPAPDEVTSTNGVAVRISSERTRTAYRNRQRVIAGTAGQRIIDTVFQGDGVARAFDLRYPGTGLGLPMLCWETIGGVPLYSGLDWYAGDPVDYTTSWWVFNANQPTSEYGRVVQHASRPTLAVGETLTVRQVVDFPVVFEVHLESWHTDPWDHIVSRPDCYDRDAAEALAAELIAENQTEERTRLTSHLGGFRPGQHLPITIPERGLSGLHVVTSATAGDDVATEDGVSYEIECVAGAAPGQTFLDTYRQWAGESSQVISGAGWAPVPSVSRLHAHLGGSDQLVYRASWDAVGPGDPVFVCPSSGPYTLRARLKAEDGTTEAQVRLYDLTDDAAVTASTLSSTATSWTEAAATVSLVGGHRYRAEIQGSDNAHGVSCGHVTVEL
jgi:hypothetical protein